MSAKAGSQPGRRTPLSLSGAKQQQQQQQFNKPSSGPNGNPGNAKNDSKATRSDQAASVEVKETNQKDTKKQQQQQQNLDKKPANAPENAKKSEKTEENKSQNGVGKTNGAAKDKQQNGNEEKTTEKKEKPEKVEKNVKPAAKDDKKDNREEKEKEVEKKDKEVEKKEKDPEKKPERETKTKKNDPESADKKKTEKNEVEKMDVSMEKKPPATPTKPVVERKSATPIKQVEKRTPTKAAEKAVTPAKKTNTMPSSIIADDVEMEPIAFEKSPAKIKVAAPTTAPSTVPAATSTPGAKVALGNKRSIFSLSPKSETQQQSASPDRKACPRSLTQISGRRSIRPLNEYTPSYLQSNAHFRESYRRINTELDYTSNTNNTSLNVTVGSEVPNNSSFSFFGRGRKRDRTPPDTQSAMELQTDADSPPKRARLDMQSLFSVVSSPLTLLRSRFSKASIQSSTPVKLRSKLAAEDEVEVQNVSGVSIEEEEMPIVETDENTATQVDVEEITVGNEAGGLTPQKGAALPKEDTTGDSVELATAADEKCEKDKLAACGLDAGESTDDIKITETPLVDPSANKNKRCSIM